MKKIIPISILLFFTLSSFSQHLLTEADSMRKQGLLMPALMKYAGAMAQDPSSETSYQIASTTALLWTSQMRDTSFYFLNYALQHDSSLTVLFDPHFLSLIDDPRWKTVEDSQIRKHEVKNKPIENRIFARALFRMIIKDQGLMFAGNIERREYINNGGYFSSPSIFPLLALEEENKRENEKLLLKLLDQYGWPTATAVTEYAAAGAALIINHTTYELRSKYFPMLEEAFKNGEAQPLRYAKMKDRLLVEEGKSQLYGTQIKFEHLKREPYPIKAPEYVDKRRSEIGLGPLKPYLKEKFQVIWKVDQKE